MPSAIAVVPYRRCRDRSDLHTRAAERSGRTDRGEARFVQARRAHLLDNGELQDFAA